MSRRLFEVLFVVVFHPKEVRQRCWPGEKSGIRDSFPQKKCMEDIKVDIIPLIYIKIARNLDHVFS